LEDLLGRRVNGELISPDQDRYGEQADQTRPLVMTPPAAAQQSFTAASSSGFERGIHSVHPETPQMTTI
jgi:hypothetical protein